MKPMSFAVMIKESSKPQPLSSTKIKIKQGSLMVPITERNPILIGSQNSQEYMIEPGDVFPLPEMNISDLYIVGPKGSILRFIGFGE